MRATGKDREHMGQIADWCEEHFGSIDAPLKAAEIGISLGVFTAYILEEMQNLQLVAIDRYDLPHRTPYSDPIATRSVSGHMACMKKAKESTAFAGSRVEVVRSDHVDVARKYKDGYFDWVFLDGDHGYEATLEAIDVWLPKVRKGGLLMGHDIDSEFGKKWNWGVRQAVEERFGQGFDLGVGMLWRRLI